VIYFKSRLFTLEIDNCSIRLSSMYLLSLLSWRWLCWHSNKISGVRKPQSCM